MRKPVGLEMRGKIEYYDEILRVKRRHLLCLRSIWRVSLDVRVQMAHVKTYSKLCRMRLRYRVSSQSTSLSPRGSFLEFLRKTSTDVYGKRKHFPSISQVKSPQVKHVWVYLVSNSVFTSSLFNCFSNEKQEIIERFLLRVKKVPNKQICPGLLRLLQMIGRDQDEARVWKEEEQSRREKEPLCNSHCSL